MFFFGDFHQLLPYITSEELLEKAFRVIPGDYVTTEDGTGIVHIAPTYGGDDFRVAKEAGVPAILVKDENGKEVPTVNRTGRFVQEITDFAGRFVKEEYYGKFIPKFKFKNISNEKYIDELSDEDYERIINKKMNCLFTKVGLITN